MAESYLNRGVTCFSERPDSILLWSHYGGGHCGFCLEFDTASPLLAKLHKVTYSDDLLELNTAKEIMGDGSFIMDILLRKASCWSYEEEWRAIHMEGDKEDGYGVEALTGLYFGAGMTPAEKDLIGHMLHGSPTQLYEVSRSGTSLRLETRHVTYTPYKYGAAAPQTT